MLLLHLQQTVLRGVEVVAQLAERSLLTPEVQSSNPDIGKSYLLHSADKAKIKKKRPGKAPLTFNTDEQMQIF